MKGGIERSREEDEKRRRAEIKNKERARSQRRTEKGRLRVRSDQHITRRLPLTKLWGERISGHLHQEERRRSISKTRHEYLSLSHTLKLLWLFNIYSHSKATKSYLNLILLDTRSNCSHSK